MARVSQSIYSPLPQSISDSDSEKEICMDPVCSSYGNHGNYYNGKVASLRKTQGAHFEKLKDESPQVQSISPKLSPLRKCAFIVSIILCFLPVVLLLWILPCSDTNSCKSIISTWENRLTNIEFKGAINVIRGVSDSNLNLAVLYKGSESVDEELNHGVISFLGINGAIAWNFRQDIVPEYLDCSLIDVNGNGINDCLLLDERGLKVLGTISGEIIWHAHSHEEGKTICDLGFPVKIPDLNQDNINELLMVYKHESLLIVCGRSGKALRSILLPCQDIGKLKLSNFQNIEYSCFNGTENYLINMGDLRKKYRNESYHIDPVRISNTSHHENIEYVNVSRRRILVDSYGVYPNCSAKLTLFDDILNEKIGTWNLDNSYVTQPKNFSLKLTKANSSFPKGYVSGFLFKVWQWSNNVTTHDLNGEDLPRNNNYTVNNITERIVLIAYNYTNSFSFFNLSVTEITQLCFVAKNGGICQPNLQNQKESVLITELGEDNSQELITYSASFRHVSIQNVKQTWQLVSTVTVENLQNVLQRVLTH